MRYLAPEVVKNERTIDIRSTLNNLHAYWVKMVSQKSVVTIRSLSCGATRRTVWS